MHKIRNLLMTIVLVFTVSGCSEGEENIANPITVNISVDAQTAYEKDYIDYEYILEDIPVKVEDGSSVWNVLNKVAKNSDIPVVKKGSDTTLYVTHINSIGEFDFEHGSGWMYNVNGKYPNYGADSEKSSLKDGDNVQFRFSLDLGKDIGASQANE